MRTVSFAAAAAALAALAAWAAAEEVARPEMRLVDTKAGPKGNKVLVFKHKAVAGMDSPGYAAQGYEHGVCLSLPGDFEAEPKKTRALLISLHGFGDTTEAYADAMSRWFADRDCFVLGPNDSLGTWFYGYSDQLPGGDPSKGMVVNYTERRILFYLEHFKSQYPIDPNRIYLSGGSMGGTGSVSLALRYPKVFAGADAKKGATNRLYCHWKSQCERIWGKSDSAVKNNEGVNVWDWQNMSEFARTHAKETNWIRTLNGREDTSIPFRQVAGPPGVKPMSFYAAMETFKTGHLCLWDCSSHGKPDPGKPSLDDWWEPFFDGTCFLRLDLSFPAFTGFSADDDPGTGAGDAVGGEDQLGDNTYDGTPRGGLNRWLRWNSNTIVDTEGEWAMELKMSSGPGGYKGGKTETVDVTPRRLHSFAVKPGAKYSWTTSMGQSGEAAADADGILTIPKVGVTTAWTKLIVKPAGGK